jgi:hypothetical protein
MDLYYTASAATVLYHARSSPGFPSCTCRSIAQSRNEVRMIIRYVARRNYLLIEDPVVFVDICDVAFILMGPFPRELALLINTVQSG